MNKTKESMMRNKSLSIMTLEFFSIRFNIRKELLSWGIEKITTEDSVSFAPVVLVDGDEMFIDIRKDCRSPRRSVYGSEAELLPAKMTETEEAYIFSAEGAEYIFTKEDVEALYERKVML